MKYAIYNQTGEITRVVEVPAEIIEAQLLEGEAYLECDAQPHDEIDVATKTLVKRQPPPSPFNNTKPQQKPYAELRGKLYPTVGTQLDLLFKDIDEGVFGENAKGSSWYKRIKTVKEAVPKDQPVDPLLVYFMETLPAAEIADPLSQSTTPDRADLTETLQEMIYYKKKKVKDESQDA